VPVFRYRFGSSPTLKFTDEELCFLSHAGVNCLQIWHIPYMEKLTPSDMFPWNGEFIKEDKATVGFLNDIFDRAQKYGMDCYLFVRGTKPFTAYWDAMKHELIDPAAEIFEKFPDVKGSNMGMDSFPFWPRGFYDRPPCFSSKNYQRFLKETCQNLFREIPNLKGIILEPMDGTLWCDDSCDACRGTSIVSRMVKYIKLLNDAAKSVRKDAKLVLYHWGFPHEDRSERDKLISEVPSDVLILNAWTDMIKQVIDGEFLHYGDHYDNTIVPIPGEVYLADCETCKRTGHEFSTLITAGSNLNEFRGIPCLPVPYSYAKIFFEVNNLGGISLFDHTGPLPTAVLNIGAEAYKWASWEPEPVVHEIFEKIAERDFGSKAAPKVVEAWRQLDVAIQKQPVGSYYLDEAIGEAWNIQLYPAENVKKFIYVQKIRGREWRYRLFEKLLDLGQPYLQKIIKYFGLTVDELAKGVDLLHGAAALTTTDKQRAVIQEEITMAEAALCKVRSKVNFLNFLNALIDNRPWLRQTMIELMKKERENSKQLKALLEKDERIGYDGWAGRMITPESLGKKILVMELELQRLERSPYVRRQFF